MSKDAHPDVAAMAEAVGSGALGRGRRSVLYRWFDARADAFGDILETQRPSWRDIAHWFAEQQITNAKGERLTPLLVKQTWQKVRRARRLCAEKMPRAAPKIVTAPDPKTAPRSALPDVSPSTTTTDEDTRARVERLMRDAALRSGRKM